MNSLKKITAVVLALIMVIGLAACGNGSQNTGNNNNAAPAPTWPSANNVTVVVPAKAGGGNDQSARILTDYLARATGKNFIVDNDTTGGGTVAYEKVRNAMPDGNTFLIFSANMVVSNLFGTYDHSVEDFTIIGIPAGADDQNAFVVPASAPYNTLQEFIDYAKAHPGELKFGGQNAAVSMLFEASFCKAAGIELKFVEAGSQPDKITAILGKHIDCADITLNAADQYVKSGDMKILGILQDERSKTYSDYPTFTELGYKDAIVPQSGLILGPKGMDEDTVKQISEYIKSASTDSTVIDSYKKMNSTLTYYTPSEAADNINNMVKIMKAAHDNIK